jgi:hypothetical protein
MQSCTAKCRPGFDFGFNEGKCMFLDFRLDGTNIMHYNS